MCESGGGRIWGGEGEGGLKTSTQNRPTGIHRSVCVDPTEPSDRLDSLSSPVTPDSFVRDGLAGWPQLRCCGGRGGGSLETCPPGRVLDPMAEWGLRYDREQPQDDPCAAIGVIVPPCVGQAEDLQHHVPSPQEPQTFGRGRQQAWHLHPTQ